MNDSLVDELEKGPNNEKKLNKNNIKMETKDEEEELWAELDHIPPQTSKSTTPTSTSVTSTNIRKQSSKELNSNIINESLYENTTPLLPIENPLTNTREKATFAVKNAVERVRRIRNSITDEIPYFVFNSEKNKDMKNNSYNNNLITYDNLDDFFISLYNYYYRKGYKAIILSEWIYIFNLLFTIVISSFLLGCINWHELATCDKDSENNYFNKNKTTTCNRSFSTFIKCKSNETYESLWELFVFSYLIILILYWSYKIVIFVTKIYPETKFMQYFYRHKLDINAVTLQNISWNEIIEKLNGFQKNDSQFIYFLVHSPLSYADSQKITNTFKTSFTNLEIASRIMKKENYMISLLNMHLFDESFYTMKLLPSKFYNNSTYNPLMSHDRDNENEYDSSPEVVSLSYVFYSSIMEQILRFCLLDHMNFLTSNGSDRTEQLLHGKLNDFLQDKETIQRRFFLSGIILFFLLPIIILFSTFNFFFKYAQEFHTNKSIFGKRKYTSLALWRFREYNELPHFFEKRILTSYYYANKYLSLFPSSVLIIIISRLIIFVTGAFLAILLLFSFIEENILLQTHLFNRQFLWYFTVFTFIFTFFRSFISTNEEDPNQKFTYHFSLNEKEKIFNNNDLNNDTSPENIMYQLSCYTHFFPKEWKKKAHLDSTKNSFSFYFFPYKVQQFIQEIISIILLPGILSLQFPKNIDKILLFIQEHSIFNKELDGYVIKKSCFDFRKDTEYHTKNDNDMNDVVIGKMEKSFLTFRENYADYKDEKIYEQDQFINKINNYKQNHSIHDSNNIHSIHIAPNGSQSNMNSLRLDNSIFTSNLNNINSTNLLQSQVIQAALLGKSYINQQQQLQQEINFYWLEKYCENEEENHKAGMLFSHQEEEDENEEKQQ